MASDRETLELVARIDDLDERTERLETLEFGTVAFPSGGGGDWVCHEAITNLGIVDTIAFLAIPQTHRHIVIVHEVAVFLLVGGFNFQDMNLNEDFGTNYDYYWRAQRNAGGGGGSVNRDAAAAAFMEVGSVPARDSAAASQRYYTAGHIWIPNYSSGSTMFHSVVWDNYSYEANEAGGEGTGDRRREEGGGHWRDAAAVTSVRFTCSGPQVFQTNSRWQLNLVCPL